MAKPARLGGQYLDAPRLSNDADSAAMSRTRCRDRVLFALTIYVLLTTACVAKSAGSLSNRSRTGGDSTVQPSRSGKTIAGIKLVPSLGVRLAQRAIGGGGVSHPSYPFLHSSLLKDCRRTARRVHFPVPCPRLLPSDSSATLAGMSGLTPITMEPWLHKTRVALSIDYYDPLRPGHIAIAASRQSVGRLLVAADPRPLSHIRLKHIIHVRCRTAALIFVKPSSTFFGGHSAVVWNERGHTYVVSFHGHDVGAQRLSIAVARSVRLVSSQ